MMKAAAIFAAIVGLLVAGGLCGTTWAEDGKDLYKRNCQSCHGESGKGNGPASRILRPPPGDLAVTLKGMSDQDTTKIIKDGGRAVGKAASMPAFSSKLSDEQVKAVVAYVKGFVK